MLDDVWGVLAEAKWGRPSRHDESVDSNRKHAQAVLRIPVVMHVSRSFAQGAGHLHDLAVHANLRRKTHQLLGRLHERHAVARRGTLKLVDGGHALVTALEGKLAHAGMRRSSSERSRPAFYMRQIPPGHRTPVTRPPGPRTPGTLVSAETSR